MFSITVPMNIKIAHDPKRGFKGNSLHALPEMMKRKEMYEAYVNNKDKFVDCSQMTIYVNHKKVYPRWDF